MMMNLFSSFDPSTNFITSLNWLSSLLWVLFIIIIIIIIIITNCLEQSCKTPIMLYMIDMHARNVQMFTNKNK